MLDFISIWSGLSVRTIRHSQPHSFNIADHRHLWSLRQLYGCNQLRSMARGYPLELSDWALRVLCKLNEAMNLPCREVYNVDTKQIMDFRFCRRRGRLRHPSTLSRQIINLPVKLLLYEPDTSIWLSRNPKSCVGREEELGCMPSTSFAQRAGSVRTHIIVSAPALAINT